MTEIRRPREDERAILPEQIRKKPVMFAYTNGVYAGYCSYDIEPDCVVFLSLCVPSGDRYTRELLVKTVAAVAAPYFSMCRFESLGEFAGFAKSGEPFPTARMNGCHSGGEVDI